MDVQTLIALPLWYLITVAAILGAVMASFGNVVAYRLHTNASLNGRSRCFSCGTTLQWYELVPVLSYLTLRGRCRTCRARIPTRDVVVEVVSALGYVLIFLTAPSVWLLVLNWALFTTLLIIATYDITHYIIPDELVLLVAGLGMVAFTFDHWPLQVSDGLALLSTVAISAGLYAALWKVSGGQWLGFGDVKLAAALALFLSFEAAFSMVVLSFWIGAAVGVALMGVSWLQRAHAHWMPAREALTFKSEIPFAPFIVAAFLVVYMYDVSVLALFTF
jgi:leader peptidase (prepilin peptidase)/N-methyltransferase